MQIIADYLLFDSMPISIYELEPWLADEVRHAMSVYWANKK